MEEVKRVKALIQCALERGDLKQKS